MWTKKCENAKEGELINMLANLADCEAAFMITSFRRVALRKRRQIIEEWGLDDTWQVTVRYRLTGHQVTAKRADGRASWHERRTEGVKNGLVLCGHTTLSNM